MEKHLASSCNMQFRHSHFCFGLDKCNTKPLCLFNENTKHMYILMWPTSSNDLKSYASSPSVWTKSRKLYQQLLQSPLSFKYIAPSETTSPWETDLQRQHVVKWIARTIVLNYAYSPRNSCFWFPSHWQWVKMTPLRVTVQGSSYHTSISTTQGRSHRGWPTLFAYVYFPNRTSTMWKCIPVPSN